MARAAQHTDHTGAIAAEAPLTPREAFARQRLAIVVDHLTERFRIPLDRPPGIKERLSTFRRAQYRQFEALKDVSLTIRHGESVGLIGHNGSGKSTLLKCLARILPPDEGTVTVNGRLASLLELGAGFHPDLTGRENVYFNGSILGFTRADIEERFDDIVDFAGVGEFIDNPVRNFSSGMYARLGFAIAVNVDPEILLVDEVLSVGDAEFQERSLAKMRGFNQRGKTVVLVTHDLGSVEDLCERVIVMNRGRVAFDGPTDEGLEFYDELIHGPKPAPVVVEAAPAAEAEPEPEPEPGADAPFRTGDRAAHVTDVRLLVAAEPGAEPVPAVPGAALPSGAVAQVALSFTAEESIRGAGSLSVGINVRRPEMQLYVYETRTAWRGMYLAPPAGATAVLTFTLDLALLTGEYLVDLLVVNASTNQIHDRWPAALSFDVASPEHDFGVAAMDARIGIWNPEGHWPADLHAPDADRGGPADHGLREHRPTAGYEPTSPRLHALPPAPAQEDGPAPSAR